MKTLAPFIVLIAAVHLRAAEPPAPIQIPVGKSTVIDPRVMWKEWPWQRPRLWMQSPFRAAKSS
jgi:hypothetical protein